MAETNVLTQILAVFMAIAEWFVDAIPVVISLFYVEATGLTFLGYLAVIALAISVVFLLMMVIERFLSFRAG